MFFVGRREFLMVVSAKWQRIWLVFDFEDVACWFVCLFVCAVCVVVCLLSVFHKENTSTRNKVDMSNKSLCGFCLVFNRRKLHNAIRRQDTPVSIFQQ